MPPKNEKEFEYRKEISQMISATKDKQKGFTLMEMLIVLAVMVILVAVSVPVFTHQLDDSKLAADEANLRAAKGKANVQYMMKEEFFLTTLYYDVAADCFVSEKPLPYGRTSENINSVISAEWNEEKKIIEVQWVEVE